MHEPRPRGRSLPVSRIRSFFPADAWGRALRRAARRNYGPLASYRDPHGLPGLQAALSDQLERHRGCAGCATSYPDPADRAERARSGGHRAGGSGRSRPGGRSRICRGAGRIRGGAACASAPCRSMRMGADLAAVIPATPPRLIYVTPSTQYPTGAPHGAASAHGLAGSWRVHTTRSFWKTITTASSSGVVARSLPCRRLMTMSA